MFKALLWFCASQLCFGLAIVGFVLFGEYAGIWVKERQKDKTSHSVGAIARRSACAIIVLAILIGLGGFCTYRCYKQGTLPDPQKTVVIHAKDGTVIGEYSNVYVCWTGHDYIRFKENGTERTFEGYSYTISTAGEEAS